MKQNLNSHDIFSLIQECQFLVGSQVVNVYDINNKTICIKLRCENNKNDEDVDKFKFDTSAIISGTEEIKENIEKYDDDDENKIDNKKKRTLKYLLIESSNKFYLMDDFKAVNTMPSSFSSKLRKHINGKRIYGFRQINRDRVIDIQFGIDDVVKNFSAFHLMCEFYASGNIILTDTKYSIMTLIHPFTYKDENDNISAKIRVGEIYPEHITTMNISLDIVTIKEFISNEMQKVDKKLKLKQFMMKLKLIMYSPNVLEHVLLELELNPNMKIDDTTDIFAIFTDEKIEQLITCINNLFSCKLFNGYIINETFIPYLYKQYEKDNYTKYDTFYEAVFSHFTKIDKFETKEVKKEKEKLEKVSKQEKVLVNINNQITGLKEKSQKSKGMLENIECDVDTLQDFLDFVMENVGIHCKINEVNFENIKLLEYIKHLNKIKFVFNNIEYEWDTSKSAHANMNNSFKLIKQTNEKIKKAEIVLNVTEKIESKKHNQSIDDLTIVIKDKKDYWFEQFNWFVTSEGFLFVSGKTSDQNETLVKKYFNEDDLYFHSDVFGSGSGILKNHKSIKLEDCVKSLEECGTFLICHTKAWKDGVPDKSYWVKKDQVSKSPETGEYNVKGAFIIRGTKNYINTNKMELGLGIIFRTKPKSESLIDDKNETVKMFDENFHLNCYDDVEFAIPVVGSYSCMSKYKFKAKIIPGTQKIKKIFPDVLGSFYKNANKYEKASIKKIKNDDFQRVLVTSLKFVL